ncbi:MAG: hypothetical protein A2017_10145 [Lentisphaerae bacterium GWF2_44_16]|nr:MAG: hypothetical protein A2017_10145 [Lentisphaerae bacterium GWF2_44_16]
MFKIDEKIERLLSAETPSWWEASGYGKEFYVKLSEPIVRQAVEWQDKDGRIIDPFVHKETSTVTPRFVGALSFLIRAGKCLDLIDVCIKSMSAGCADLYNAKNIKAISGPEFYVKELMSGYMALEKYADASLIKQWRKDLGEYNAEETYAATLAKKKAEDIHNFCTFAMAGEAFKKKYGISGDDDFIDRYMEIQKCRFTELGMYRDPNNPMTYDGVSRMNMALMLHFGYNGRHYAFADEMLRRGALTMLLYMSPAGECPYGGRSNQQNFNEAMISLLCEYEASRYKKLGNMKLAGTFKRMAKLSALSVERWLSMSPVRFTKNSFPADSQHGRQKGYGFYGAYSLLIASQFGFAHLLADDTIEEQPAPCENGSYILHLDKDFHKVFATCRGYHLEIDTNADFHYDSSGLGRIHRKDVPTELALSCPITASPGYLVSCDTAPRNVSTGPGWLADDGTMRWLADFSNEKDSASMEIIEENPDTVAFKLEYKNLKNCDGIIEEYRIDKDGIQITESIENYDKEFFVQIPLLDTDGMNKSEIKIDGNAFLVKYKNCAYRVECVYPENVKLLIEDFDAPNRNGIYKVGLLKAKSKTIKYKITLIS